MKNLLVFIFMLFSATMYGQKIAYLYTDSVLQVMPEYGKNVHKLDSTRQVIKKELDAGQVLIQQKYEKLVKSYSPKENETLVDLKKRMVPVDTLKLSAIQDESIQFEKKKTSYDRILQGTYTQDIQPIINKVTSVIKEYAIKNGFSAVYSMEQLKMAVIYIDPNQDITKVIREKLKRQPL